MGLVSVLGVKNAGKLPGWRNVPIQNMFSFKRHPQRTAKPISDKNLFIWFQSWCWTVEQEMKAKNQEKEKKKKNYLLKDIYGKESKNLIGTENIWGKT